MAARSLQRFHGLLSPVKPDDDKEPGLDPRVLAVDPERFYATLEQQLAAATFGPDPDPSPVSPASRLVDTCRHIDR